MLKIHLIQPTPSELTHYFQFVIRGGIISQLYFYLTNITFEHTLALLAAADVLHTIVP